MAGNEKALREIVDDINQGRMDRFGALADNYKIHEPVDGDLDREGFKKMIGRYRAAFPDMKMSTDELIEAGDRVLHRWTMRGTHKGELRGLPPTNRNVEVRGISVLRFEGGKAVEEWVEWDALGLMRQLGAGEKEARPSP